MYYYSYLELVKTLILWRVEGHIDRKIEKEVLGIDMDINVDITKY